MGIEYDILGLRDLKITDITEKTDFDKGFKVMALAYTGAVPDRCPVCGAPLYKHGIRHIRVNDTPFQGWPCVLDISVPRYRCRGENEKHIWTPTFADIDEKHKMTKRALRDITVRSMRTTFEDTAGDYMMTGRTINNVFVDFIRENTERLRFKTPQFIGIDEIKVKKIGELTVVTDLEHHTLYDILLGRNQPSLSKYFMAMKDRESVLWVCSDMYRPFEKSISMALPNARWAIDHFHVVMKANEAVDAVRRTLQSSMTKMERISTKRGLAYTLKTRAKDLSPEEAIKIRLLRSKPDLKPLATAFDLKEDFFNIYDENMSSKDDAQKAFAEWEKSIPEDSLYDKFRELAGTVHNFYEQIFAYWDCPITISNGYTECMNRLIRENNLKGRGYSFEVLRARTLYRRANLSAILEKGLLDTVGPVIQEDKPNFHLDSTKGEDMDEDDEWEPFPDVDPDTGEILE